VAYTQNRARLGLCIDIRFPWSNRLEKLKGDWAGFWSLRINAQWRIVFRWQGQDAIDVQVIDHHQASDMLPKKRPPTHPEFRLGLQRDRDLWHAMDSHRKVPPLKKVR
jgi:proteic killer suppression protein